MSSPVLSSRFATSDFDRAREVLAAAYGDHEPVLRGAPERFVYDATAVEVDGLRVDHFDFGSQVESRYSPFEDTLVIGWLRRGVFSVDDGERHRTLGAGGLVWFRPDRPQHILTDEVSFDFARLDIGALGRAAAEIAGIDPGGLRFHPGEPVSDERTRYWAATRRWIADGVLGDESVAAEPLVCAEALTALAQATLLAVPNTALDALADPIKPAPGRGEPAVVRRAMEFMDTHAGEGISITDIAQAARIGPRGLQAAFRRHRDEPPLRYLRRVRMDRAHRDLEAGDPTRGDTVGAICARWGFANPGRFAADYRRAHGCWPGETLRR